jgi:hypothetical protein
MAHGRINDVEVTYRLMIKNYSLIGSGAKKMADDFIGLIHEIRARGCPVEMGTDRED